MSAPVALSAANPKVKELRQLLTRRSARDDAGCVVVEGIHAVDEALVLGLVRAVYVRSGDPPTALIERALSRTPAVYALDDKTFDALATTTTPQPALAVVGWRHASIEELDFAGPIVVLDAVGDPGNVGTIVRVAEAAGATAVIGAGGTADFGSPKVVRAAAGSLLRVPLTRAAYTLESVRELRAHGMRCLVSDVKRGEPYDRFDWREPIALVIGSEAHGVDDAVRAAADATVTIAMHGQAESLNVAVATAVLLFELRRARGLGGR